MKRTWYRFLCWAFRRRACETCGYPLPMDYPRRNCWPCYLREQYPDDDGGTPE